MIVNIIIINALVKVNFQFFTNGEFKCMERRISLRRYYNKNTKSFTGEHIAKLELDEEPIIIQTLNVEQKNGIHKTAKQIYCDLLIR